jgi:hypothetical protein
MAGEAVVVVIGRVNSPIARSGEVRSVPASHPGLDRAVKRGWVEVTHEVSDGEVTEVSTSPDPAEGDTDDELLDLNDDDDDEDSADGADDLTFNDD